MLPGHVDTDNYFRLYLIDKQAAQARLNFNNSSVKIQTANFLTTKEKMVEKYKNIDIEQYVVKLLVHGGQIIHQDRY